MDYLEKIEFLNDFAEQEDCIININVLHLIAQNYDEETELLRALKRIIGSARFFGRDVSIESATDALKEDLKIPT